MIKIRIWQMLLESVSLIFGGGVGAISYSNDGVLDSSERSLMLSLVNEKDYEK